MATVTTLGTDYTTSATGLYNFLSSNAVPNYFSSVTNSSGTITCNVEVTENGTTSEVALLTIQSTASPLKITVRTRFGITHVLSISSRYFQTAYLCSGGITLCADNNLVPAFTITLDEDGMTTLIYNDTLTLSTSTSSASKVYTINVDTTTPNLSNAYSYRLPYGGTGDFVKTALSPIVVNGNEGDVVSDTLFVANAQFTMTGNYNRIWVVDGVNYWCNGIWAVLDGE